jgi:hypothetical protein
LAKQGQAERLQRIGQKHVARVVGTRTQKNWQAVGAKLAQTHVEKNKHKTLVTNAGQRATRTNWRGNAARAWSWQYE